MPVSPTAGVPPSSTIESVSERFEHFPTPYFIAPGLNSKNFYTQNGQIILASIVAILFIVFLFLAAPSASGQPFL